MSRLETLHSAVCSRLMWSGKFDGANVSQDEASYRYNLLTPSYGEIHLTTFGMRQILDDKLLFEDPKTYHRRRLYAAKAIVQVFFEANSIIERTHVSNNYTFLKPGLVKNRHLLYLAGIEDDWDALPPDEVAVHHGYRSQIGDYQHLDWKLSTDIEQFPQLIELESVLQ